MGAGRLAGFAIASVLTYKIMKKGGVGKDLKKAIRDLQKPQKKRKMKWLA